MQGIYGKFESKVSPSVWITLAMMLLMLPLKWIIAAILAAAVHELCHAAAVLLCGGRISQLQIGENGAVMFATPLLPVQEMFCLLAGPAGGLLLLLFLKWIPRTAICAAVQSAYNLMPLWHLDGGRALRCLLRWLSPGRAEKICLWAGRSFLAALFALAAYGTVFLDLGILPLILVAGVYLRTKSVKIPCKPVAEKVQ